MIKVIAAGVYSSFQDLGRFGYRNCGVPLSGGMDLNSLVLANTLVGNYAHHAVLEFTATGPILEFYEPAVIAISGADFAPMVDGEPMGMNVVFAVSPGSVLSFGVPTVGLRGYLSIKGGFNAERVLGSTSYYKGVTEPWQIHKGDILEFQADAVTVERKRFKSADQTVMGGNVLEVFPGPEYSLVPEKLRERLSQTIFSINSQSSRMAYLLDHTEKLTASPIISAPVQPGTVQITPGGRTIVLMRDAQTTGGYARIFQLTETAVNILAQKRAGESLQFKIKN